MSDMTNTQRMSAITKLASGLDDADYATIIHRLAERHAQKLRGIKHDAWAQEHPEEVAEWQAQLARERATYE